jgi:hypothetical protein
MNANNFESALVRRLPRKVFDGFIREHSCSFMAKNQNARIECSVTSTRLPLSLNPFSRKRWAGLRINSRL